MSDPMRPRRHMQHQMVKLAAALQQELAVIACVIVGHRWYVHQSLDAHGRRYGPWRVCSRCPAMQTLTTAPPTGHPDTMQPLSLADEQTLAALAGELDGDGEVA